MAICWATIIADGYDLIVYGSVLPSLLQYRAWNLTEVQAGTIGSYALAGMLFGALIVGTITDIVGRRKIMLFCITWFSLSMGLCAIAPSPELFGLFRFVAGLGLGGVIPTAIALTIEYAPPRRRNLTNSLMFCGYSVGGIIAALLSIMLLSQFGFRVMFFIGMLPLVTILPLAYKYLPESIDFLLTSNRKAEAETLAQQYEVSLANREPASVGEDSTRESRLAGLTALFSRSYLAATLLFFAACFMGLLLVYGLNTWLSNIMFEAGYPLNSSLTFLLVLNLGAIVGTPLVGAAADRFGSRPVVTLAFLAAAASIFLLSFQMPSLLLYLFVAVAGVGTIGTTILVNAYTANYYPATSRATALGWSLGVGRIGAIIGPTFGGLVAASSLGFEWNFYAFAVPALLGALTIFLIPRGVPSITGESSPEAAESDATVS